MGPTDVELAPLTTNPADVTGPISQSQNHGQPAEGSACPPPLAWTDVLHAFQTTSEQVEARHGKLIATARVWGEGDRPLYILNGICGDADLFCLLGWLLRDDFRVVVIDYPKAARSIDDCVFGLAAIADQLGDAQFNLFATSFGSAVALRAATGDAENSAHRNLAGRIDRMILQGVVTKFRLSLFERLSALIFKWLPLRLRHVPLRRRIHEAAHRLWYPPVDQTRWEFHLANTGQTKIAEVSRRALWLHGQAHEWRKIATPTLIVSCEGEASQHQDAAAKMARELPSAQFDPLSNSGHVPFITHPHRLAALIREFVGENTNHE